MSALKQAITPNQFAFYENHNTPTPSRFLDWVQLLTLVENPIIARTKRGLSAIIATDAPAKTKTAVLSHNRFTLLWIDLDEGNHDKNDLAKKLESLLGSEISYLIHSTYSATPKNRKWRVLIEINPPLRLDDWQAVQVAFSRLFGGDEAATRPQQIMYLPVKKSKNAFYEYRIGYGDPWGIDSMSGELKAKIEEVRAEQQPVQTLQPVPVDTLLEQAKNAKPKAHTLPAGKGAIIDQVNATYEMAQVLQAYGYTQHGNKWKHPQSESGLAGVVLLDGRYYSHHNSDPLADGFTHDVFDVLTQWRFGGDANQAVNVLANELDPQGQQQRQRDYMAGNDPVMNPQPVPVVPLQDMPHTPEQASQQAPAQDPPLIPLNVDLPPVPAFDLALLPDAFHPWLKDIQERMQCPLDFLGVGAMVGVAGLVGRKVAIYPKQYDDWLVTPNLWGAMIGRPSIMKTPALNEVMKPVHRLAKQAEESHEQQLVDHEVDKVALEAEKKAAEDAIKKAAKAKGADASMNMEVAKQNYRDILEAEAQNTPTEKRYLINDATVEAVGIRLNENPNGLTLMRDELAGWIRGLDREDKSNDRAFYLECFNGNGYYIYDRVGRGTLKIESTTLSIIGGIQPSVLAPYVSQSINNGAGNDGLIQRFQLAVYPDDCKAWQNIDRQPDHQAKEQAFSVFEALAELEPQRNEDDSVKGLRFSPEAQAVFNSWRESLEAEIRTDDIHPAMESHLAKYRSLMPSLALLLELTDNPQAQTVGIVAVNKAVAWCEYLKAHAERIYHGAIDQTTVAAKTIFDKREKLDNPFKPRDVVRKGWAGLVKTETVKNALAILVEHGYLIEQIQAQPTGRPSEIYRWNQSINFSEKH